MRRHAVGRRDNSRKRTFLRRRRRHRKALLRTYGRMRVYLLRMRRYGRARACAAAAFARILFRVAPDLHAGRTYSLQQMLGLRKIFRRRRAERIDRRRLDRVRIRSRSRRQRRLFALRQTLYRRDRLRTSRERLLRGRSGIAARYDRDRRTRNIRRSARHRDSLLSQAATA